MGGAWSSLQTAADWKIRERTGKKRRQYGREPGEDSYIILYLYIDSVCMCSYAGFHTEWVGDLRSKLMNFEY